MECAEEQFNCEKFFANDGMKKIHNATVLRTNAGRRNRKFV